MSDTLNFGIVVATSRRIPEESFSPINQTKITANTMEIVKKDTVVRSTSTYDGVPFDGLGV